MAKYETYNDYAPSIINWLISVLGTFIVFTTLFLADAYSTGLYFNKVQNRLLLALNESKLESIIMNDDYFKALPDKKVKKIEKIVRIYFSIKSDNFEEAKIVLNQTYGKGSSRVAQLNSLIDQLYDIKKNKKLEDKEAEIPSLRIENNIKQKAANLVIKIFKKEALPKISSLKKSIYETLSNKIGSGGLVLISNF